MFKPGTPGNNGAEIIAQILENDKQNQALDDTAVLNTGIAEGTVVKWSSSLSKWVACDGTVALESTDTIGVVTYANGTSGQVKTSGVYVDADLSTLGKYYCQSDGTIGQTETKVFIGTVSSTGRLCLPGGGGGGVQPATAEALGGVMIGNGIDVDANGKISLNPVLPPWGNYRGDGSDGDFTAAGGETLSGVKQYNSFTIGAGLTVNVGADPLIILCQGDVLIDGALNGVGGIGGTGSSSATGGVGVGGGTNGAIGAVGEAYPSGEKGTGGGAGGYGKTSTNATIATAGSYLNLFDKLICSQGETPSSIWQSIMTQNTLSKAGGGGGGGNTYGAGGGGGGTILLAGETVSNNGTLDISGGAKSTGTGSNNNIASGGGAGGASIVIIAKNIIISGTITVKGGDGGLCKNTATSQNGGAGWYKIFTAGA